VHNRPLSENAKHEEPHPEGTVFDYDAKPNRFYIRVESSGVLPPDVIVKQGVEVMQKKLAAILHELHNSGDNEMGGGDDYDGPRSPDVDAGGGDNWDGFQTAYGAVNSAANQAAWGNAPGGSTTPGYGTSYGNSGGYTGFN
jgi:DNA-directed RNA polymerase II subunit RPB3